MASEDQISGHPAVREIVAAFKKALGYVFLFSVCVNLLMLAVPVYMLQLFDRVVATQSPETLVVLSVMVVAAILCMVVLEIVRSRIMMVMGGWLEEKCGAALLEGSIRNAGKAGEGTAQPLRDLASLRAFLFGSGIFPVLDAMWIPVFLGIVWWMHPLLGTFSTIGGVILFGFAIANDVLTRQNIQKASAASGRSLNHADAAVRNADAVLALGMRGALVGRWMDGFSDAAQLHIRSAWKTGIISSLAKLVRLLVQVSILGGGAWLAMQQEISPGTMIAASIIMGRGLAPIEQSIQSWRAIISNRDAFTRVKATLASSQAGPAPTPLPRPESHILLEQVTWIPPKSKDPVLKRLSLEVKAGEILGLIGPTASGKTSLARLLAGSLVPGLGKIRLGGIDLAGWDSEDRGKYIGYLPQYVQLFDGTIRDNISRLQGDGEDDAIFAAAKKAGIHDMVLRLPKAYDTEIGPAGVRLSGGQRQRIALARALYGDPALVVLDEPNSNLDLDGEQALIQALETLRAEGIATVLVAQHTGILRVADSLAVMKDGKIAHHGPRDEIMDMLGQEQEAIRHV